MNRSQADRENLLDWAFVSSLVGGILILVGGVAMAFMAPFGAGMMGMMGGGFAPVWWAGMVLWLALWSIVAGIVVLVGATRIRKRGENTFAWGVAIVVAGALSLMGMGGFMLGSLAAIAGGVLAIVATQTGRRTGEQRSGE